MGSRGISASFSIFVYEEGKLSDSPSKSQMALVADGKWSVKKPPAGRADALKHQYSLLLCHGKIAPMSLPAVVRQRMYTIACF